MSEITQARHALVARILEGEGVASAARRRAAFANDETVEPVKTLVDKVAQRSHRVTDADVAAVRAAGLSEDEIFEVVVCAAVGQAVRQHDVALAALAVAVSEGEHASRDSR